MEMAIFFAVLASFCTATASVCQRIGARSSETSGFDIGLVFRLARQPIWLLGVASMIGGFLFQLVALHFGALALVQPILAIELLLVFGYMAVAGSGRVRVRRRDWLAAAAMSAGIALFLGLASPSGGRLHAPAPAWLLAGRSRSAWSWWCWPWRSASTGMPSRPGPGAPPCSAPPPASPGASSPRSSRSSARTLATASARSSPTGRFTYCSWWGRRPCCWRRTRWRRGRWPPHSRGSPSSTRCPRACSACSCSTSTSGRASLTWRARRWRWASSSPVPRSSATAA